MQFTTRTVRSKPGLSQEEALDSLQNHPLFKQGTKIASLRKRGKVWVAELHEPVTAGFPPSENEGGSEPPSGPPSDSGSSDSGSSDSSSDSSSSDSGSDDSSSPSPSGDSGDSKPSHGGESGGTDKQILHTLQQILHALQGGEPEPSFGGGDDLGPGPDDVGGPDAGLSSFGDSPAGSGSGPGAKLKPGEVPNRPGAVPLGSPAFASTHTSNPSVPPAATPGGPAGAPTGGTCPPGQKMVGGQCVPENSVGTAPGTPTGPGMTAATYTVARADDGMSIKQAKAELEAQFNPHGYRVARIRREAGVIRALVTRR